MKRLFMVFVLCLVFCSQAWGAYEKSGIVYYPSDGDSFENIITAVEARGEACTIKFLHKSGASTPFEVDSGLTVPSYVTLDFERGAMIELVNADVSINNQPVAQPYQQIYSYTGTGVVNTYYNTVYVGHWGAVGDGDGAGGGTDDAQAIQYAFDAVNPRDGAQVVSFEGNRVYRLDSGVSMIATETGAANKQGNIRIIDGNGAWLDFSGAGITGDFSAGDKNPLLELGSATNPADPDDPKSIVEKGLLTVRDLYILGPEATRAPFDAPDPGVTSPTTATIGIRFVLASDVYMENVYIEKCTTGIETKDTWPLQANKVHIRDYWVGCLIGGGSTAMEWTGVHCTQGGYGFVLRAATDASSPNYGAFATIGSQNFYSCRVEDAWYGWVAHPADTDIRGLQIENPYTEGIRYDFLSAGNRFSLANVDDPEDNCKTDAGNDVDRMLLNVSGKLSYNGFGGSGATTYYALRGTNSDTVGITHSRMHITALESNVTGVMRKSILELTGSDENDAGIIKYTNNEGNTSVAIDMKNSGILLGNLASGASQTADNYLDFYKESDFTPTIAGSGTAGTPTYTAQDGHATRIGDTVFFQLKLAWSALAGGAGNLIVGGLPYTSNSDTDRDTALSIYAGSLTYSNDLFANIIPDSTTIELRTMSSGAGVGSVAVDTSATVFISGCYQVD